MGEARVDLNADVGESFYERRVGCDDQLIPLVTSVNIACGFHGGDPSTIAHALDVAIQHKVRVGAHPSYYDLKHFGRVSCAVSAEVLEAQIAYQLAALTGLAALRQQKLSHVKLHGMLYHDVSRDPARAEAVLRAIQSVCPSVAIVSAAGSAFAEQAVRQG